MYDPLSPFQVRYCEELLRCGDPVRSTILAGASEQEAPSIARRLSASTAIRQYLDERQLERMYRENVQYRNPLPPVIDNVYYCCGQKTGSQWLKRVFLDPAVYRATGLRVFPYVALGNRFARFEGAFPKGSVITHLYIGFDAYRTIPKPERYRAFYVLRDPRDALVSWYFSVRYSHASLDPIPRLRERLNQLELDEGMIFMIEQLVDWQYFDCQRSWVGAEARDASVRLFRYEAMAANEADFLAGLFAYLDIEMGEQAFTDLYRRHAFERYTRGRSKGQEDPRSYFRNAVAGDWQNKMSRRVQAHFYARTGDLVEALGYER